MATIKKIKMFDENGILTPEALLIINDSAFLAEMAYKNREKLKEVSLNPDAKDDEIIIIQNQGISSQNRDPRVKPEDDIVWNSRQPRL